MIVVKSHTPCFLILKKATSWILTRELWGKPDNLNCHGSYLRDLHTQLQAATRLFLAAKMKNS